MPTPKMIESDGIDMNLRRALADEQVFTEGLPESHESDLTADNKDWGTEQ